MGFGNLFDDGKDKPKDDYFPMIAAIVATSGSTYA